MTRSDKSSSEPTSRMPTYRQRMRAAGLRPIQIWVPDTRAPGFAELCRRQSLAIAAFDAASDDLNLFIASVQDWPEP